MASAWPPRGPRGPPTDMYLRLRARVTKPSPPQGTEPQPKSNPQRQSTHRPSTQASSSSLQPWVSWAGRGRGALPGFGGWTAASATLLTSLVPSLFTQPTWTTPRFLHLHGAHMAGPQGVLMGLEAGCHSQQKEVGQRRARKSESGCVQGGGEGEVAQVREGEDRQTDRDRDGRVGAMRRDRDGPETKGGVWGAPVRERDEGRQSQSGERPKPRQGWEREIGHSRNRDPGRQRPAGSESNGEQPGTGTSAPQRPSTGRTPAPPWLNGSFPAPTLGPGSFDFRERADNQGEGCCGSGPLPASPHPHHGAPPQIPTCQGPP